MNTKRIGSLEIHVWTDCKIEPKHLERFKELSGLPITTSDVARQGSRQCSWPLNLDPSTYVGPIGSVAEHIGLASWFFRDNSDCIRELQSESFVFWLVVSGVVLDCTLELEVATMEELSNLGIAIRLTS